MCSHFHSVFALETFHRALHAVASTRVAIALDISTVYNHLHVSHHSDLHTTDNHCTRIVWPLCFQGSTHTCAMPLPSESKVRVAGSSSKDMRSEDASFASAVTVAYSEGLDELIVFFDRALA